MCFIWIFILVLGYAFILYIITHIITFLFIITFDMLIWKNLIRYHHLGVSDYYTNKRKRERAVRPSQGSS